MPTAALTSSATQRSIRIANIETGEELIASAGRAVAVLNGSRLRFSIADSRITSGTVRAFDASAALVRSAAGEWTASLRYVDSSNPPSPDPALQITLQTDRGPQTLRLPVTELHQ